jgi:hypothetical protein
MQRLTGVAIAIALVGASLGCATQTQDPPNFRVTYDPAQLVECDYKGIVDYNRDRLYSDVQEIRAPEMRLRVSSLGGNTILVLPGQALKVANKAVVYACPDPTGAAPMAAR